VEDLSDNERAEQLRGFLRENLPFLLLAIAIGIGGVAGFRYWQSHQRGDAEAGAAAYESVLSALSANQREQAEQRALELRKSHPKSPYADQADLALARAAVARRDYDAASRLLRGVLDGAGDSELRHVARTRLARVTIEQGRYDDAVALLPTADAGAFSGLYHEIRGDALAAKGDADTARSEYAAALSVAAEESGLDSAFIALNRDSLPTDSPAAVTGPGTAVEPATTAAPAPAKAQEVQP
jgi:predicted negative regulator of RcsB-dependent stress response